MTMKVLAMIAIGVGAFLVALVTRDLRGGYALTCSVGMVLYGTGSAIWGTAIAGERPRAKNQT